MSKYLVSNVMLPVFSKVKLISYPVPLSWELTLVIFMLVCIWLRFLSLISENESYTSVIAGTVEPIMISIASNTDTPITAEVATIENPIYTSPPN